MAHQRVYVAERGPVRGGLKKRMLASIATVVGVVVEIRPHLSQHSAPEEQGLC